MSSHEYGNQRTTENWLPQLPSNLYKHMVRPGTLWVFRMEFTSLSLLRICDPQLQKATSPEHNNLVPEKKILIRCEDCREGSSNDKCIGDVIDRPQGTLWERHPLASSPG
uniref:Uncharacterized protein n=1 Tax=Mus musculus TaxID=10090 RepID=Q3V2H0_MOUSE|nr:unnamed protein product [Mus musculus]